MIVDHCRGSSIAGNSIEILVVPSLLCAVGTIDISPAIYRWEEEAQLFFLIRPVGTVEAGWHEFNRPYGTEEGFYAIATQR